MDFLRSRHGGNTQNGHFHPSGSTSSSSASSSLRNRPRHSMLPGSGLAKPSSASFPSRRTVSSAATSTPQASGSTTPVSRPSKAKGRSIAELVAEDRRSSGRRGSLPHTGSPYRFPLTPSSASRYAVPPPQEKRGWYATLLPGWPKLLTVEYVTEAPGRLWSTVEESVVVTMLEDLDAVGWAVGAGCNGLHLFIRLCGAWAASSGWSGRSWWSGFMDDEVGYGGRLEEVKRLARESDKSSRWTGGWFTVTTLLSLAMVMLSCANTYRLITSTRPYRLHHRNADDAPVKSPNAHLIPDPTYIPPPPPSWLSRIGSVLSLLVGWKPSVDESDARPGEVIQLNVWDPTEWSLRLFVLYPPPNALMLHFVKLSESFPLWLIAMAFTVAQTHLVVAFYSQLVKDRATVQQEVMREYNQKFVYPKTFKYKKDACVMTSSAEFIRRDEWMS